jgi:hypothetical protein
MDIKVKAIACYNDVTLKEGNTTIEIGMLDRSESMDLARTLRDAIHDLLEQEDYDTIMKEE